MQLESKHEVLRQALSHAQEAMAARAGSSDTNRLLVDSVEVRPALYQLFPFKGFHRWPWIRRGWAAAF